MEEALENFEKIVLLREQCEDKVIPLVPAKLAQLGLNRESIQFVLVNINGDSISLSQEFIQVFFYTCLVPFIRANTPMLNSKDVAQ